MFSELKLGDTVRWIGKSENPNFFPAWPGATGVVIRESVFPHRHGNVPMLTVNYAASATRLGFTGIKVTYWLKASAFELVNVE